MLKVRTSERRTFKRCRKRWDYQYLQRLDPKRHSSALWVGTAVHKGLEVYYSATGTSKQLSVTKEVMERYAFMERGRLGYNKMDEEDRNRLNADIDLALGMVDHYTNWAPKNDDFEVVETEFYAEVPLSKGIRLTMRADGLAVDKEGGAWVLEHKTTTQIDQDAAWLELDDQASSYTWMFNELAAGHGWVLREDKLVPIAQVGPTPQIRGILYNFLLKQVPHEPILNQDGSLSVGSKNLTCTVEDYEAAFKGMPGQGDAKYQDFIQRLRAKKWFHRLRVYRGGEEMENFRIGVGEEIAEMQAVRTSPDTRRAYRNPTRDCNWDCPYFTMCKGELEGLEMDVEKSENFVVEEQLKLEEVK